MHRRDPRFVYISHSLVQTFFVGCVVTFYLVF